MFGQVHLLPLMEALPPRARCPGIRLLLNCPVRLPFGRADVLKLKNSSCYLNFQSIHSDQMVVARIGEKTAPTNMSLMSCSSRQGRCAPAITHTELGKWQQAPSMNRWLKGTRYLSVACDWQTCRTRPFLAKRVNGER